MSNDSHWKPSADFVGMLGEHFEKLFDVNNDPNNIKIVLTDYLEHLDPMPNLEINDQQKQELQTQFKPISIDSRSIVLVEAKRILFTSKIIAILEEFYRDLSYACTRIDENDQNQKDISSIFINLIEALNRIMKSEFSKYFPAFFDNLANNSSKETLFSLLPNPQLGMPFFRCLNSFLEKCCLTQDEKDTDAPDFKSKYFSKAFDDNILHYKLNYFGLECFSAAYRSIIKQIDNNVIIGADIKNDIFGIYKCLLTQITIISSEGESPNTISGFLDAFAEDYPEFICDYFNPNKGQKFRILMHFPKPFDEIFNTCREKIRSTDLPNTYRKIISFTFGNDISDDKLGMSNQLHDIFWSLVRAVINVNDPQYIQRSINTYLQSHTVQKFTVFEMLDLLISQTTGSEIKDAKIIAELCINDLIMAPINHESIDEIDENNIKEKILQYIYPDDLGIDTFLQYWNSFLAHIGPDNRDLVMVKDFLSVKVGLIKENRCKIQNWSKTADHNGIRKQLIISQNSTIGEVLCKMLLCAGLSYQSMTDKIMKCNKDDNHQKVSEEYQIGYINNIHFKFTQSIYSKYSNHQPLNAIIEGCPKYPETHKCTIQQFGCGSLENAAILFLFEFVRRLHESDEIGMLPVLGLLSIEGIFQKADITEAILMKEGVFHCFSGDVDNAQIRKKHCRELLFNRRYEPKPENIERFLNQKFCDFVSQLPKGFAKMPKIFTTKYDYYFRLYSDAVPYAKFLLWNGKPVSK